MKRNMVLIWAGRAAALGMVLLTLTGLIPAGGPVSWVLLGLALALILLGGGGRRRG